jgi:hypothetical protein
MCYDMMSFALALLSGEFALHREHRILDAGGSFGSLRALQINEDLILSFSIESFI